MCSRLLVLVVAAFWTIAVGAAETIRVENATAAPGQTGLLVRVLIDHSAPIYAMSFVAKYPTAGLTFEQASLTGTVFTGEWTPEYFQAITGTDYCGAAILLDLNEPYAEKTLPAGTGQFACGLYFAVSASAQCGDALAIDLRSDVGSPVIDPVFTTVVTGSVSKSVTPTLTDGTVTISVAPSVTGINPSQGSKDGGTAVTISGQYFAPSTTVTVGGQTLLTPRVVNANTITGTTRPHAVGVVDVVVNNSCGTDSAAAAFTFFGLEPIASAVTPKWGIITGGTPVTVTGQNFDAATTVTIGGAALQNKAFVNATTITGNAPAHAAGAVNVVVSNGSGTNTLVEGFAYVGAPTIELVSPNVGNGNVNVVVTGSGFTDTNDMTVLLASNPVDGLEISSGDVFMFHVPACGGATGWRTLQVFTTGGNASLAQGYSCGEEPPPIVFRRGDANCDNAHDISDAITILGYLFSSKPAKCLDALNANDSANVDIADAIFLLGYLFTQGPPPPDPFATAGVDTTPDNVGCAEKCTKP